MIDLTTDEKRVLREVYAQRLEFREYLASHMGQNLVMCPRCLDFVTDLHHPPLRLRPFLGFYGGSEICVRCLAWASTERNREMAQERREEDGVINFAGETWWGGTAALSSRPDLDGKGGQVYLARHEKLVKIGATTRGAISRINQLGGRDVYQLIMTLSLNSPFALERYLHKRFAKLRDSGEHFRLEPHHVEFVRGIRQFNGEPVAVEVVSS